MRQLPLNKNKAIATPPEILKTFNARSEKALKIWITSWQKAAELIRVICVHCNSEAQFLHYVREFLLFSGFLHFELETLVYGLLKSSEMEERDKDFTLPNKFGSFETKFHGNDEDKKRKLSLCSVQGLTYLGKMKELTASQVLEVEATDAFLNSAIKNLKNEAKDIFHVITRAFRVFKKQIKFSAYDGGYECSLIFSKDSSPVILNVVTILADAFQSGRDVGNDFITCTVADCDDEGLQHADIVATHFAAIEAEELKEQRARIERQLKAAKEEREKEERDLERREKFEPEKELLKDLFDSPVPFRSEVGEFSPEKHEAENETPLQSRSVKRTRQKDRVYSRQSRISDFIAPEDYQTGDSDATDSGSERSTKRSRPFGGKVGGKKTASQLKLDNKTYSTAQPGAMISADGTFRKRRQVFHEDYIHGVCLDISVIESSTEDTLRSEEVGKLSEGEVDNEISIVDSKLNEELDMDFKRFLLRHMKFELFKEITLERAVIAYCAKKRRLLGIKDGVKLFLNWKDTIYKLGKQLKDQFLSAKSKMIKSIELEMLNSVSSVKKVDVLSAKEQELENAKEALRLIEKSVKRKINNIEHSLLSKITSYWFSMNENLHQFLPIKGSKKWLFDTKARYLDILSSQCGDEDAPKYGHDFDGLMMTMEGTECDAKEMKQLISILEIKDPANEMPMTQTKIDKYLQKVDDKKAKGTPSSTPGDSSKNAMEVFGDGEAFASPIEAPAVVGPAVHHVGLGRLKDFLRLFYNVEFHDTNLCLKVQPKHNSKNANAIRFMQFLLRHELVGGNAPDEAFEEFKESEFFKALHCNFYIPFTESSSANTSSNGYCFYLAAYQLFERYNQEYNLSETGMKAMDRDLTKNNSSIFREGFQEFLSTIAEGLHGSDASNVKAAKFAFFSMKAKTLNPTFWGCMDWIASLHFNCSGFGDAFDPEMVQWKRFWCSSLLTRKVAEVGSLPSLAEIEIIVTNGLNFMVFHNKHFFPLVPAEQVEMQQSFQTVARHIFSSLIFRAQFLNHRKGDERSIHDPAELAMLPPFISFSDVLNGILSNDNTIDYSDWFETAARDITDYFLLKPKEHEEKRVVNPLLVEKEFLNDHERQVTILLEENRRLKIELEAFKRMIVAEGKAAAIEKVDEINEEVLE